MSVFKQKIDIIPTLHAALILLAQLALYTWLESTALLLIVGLLMTPVCFFTVPIIHNHFHVAIFRKQSLNRLIELILFFQNGFTAGSWKPTHDLHHARYLNQRGVPELRDPNAWVDISNGHTLRLRRYVIPFMLGHWKKHPLMSRGCLRYGSSWRVRTVRLLILCALVLAHPLGALTLFLTPMALSQVLTAMHSYYQHAGLDTDDPYAASYNYHGPFFLYNIGYHTAHHIKPGLHWSKLPEEHQKIENRIPAQNTRLSYFCFSKYLNST